LSDVEIEDSDLKQVVTGCKFTEGLAADAEGNLFFDCPNNRIMVLRPDGKSEVWLEPSGRTNGMKIDPEGRLVACCAQGDGGKRAVLRFGSEGQVEVLADAYDGKPLNSPNNLCFDPDGWIYFTDLRYGDRSDCEQERMGV
jgi:gluconolactonase